MYFFPEQKRIFFGSVKSTEKNKKKLENANGPCTPAI